MKIVNEDITNFNKVINNKDIVAATEIPPAMADAISDSKTLSDIRKDRLKKYFKDTENGFTGADKQPVPKKPVVTKPELDERLFEATNNTDIRRDCYYKIEEVIEKVFDNFAIELASMIPAYNPDWCSDYMNSKATKQFMQAQNMFIVKMLDMLFENAPVNESVLTEKQHSPDMQRISKDDPRRLADPHGAPGEYEKYYGATVNKVGAEEARRRAIEWGDRYSSIPREEREKMWGSWGTKKDPAVDVGDMYELINLELSPDDDDLLNRVTRFKDISYYDRYNSSDIGTDFDGNTVIFADTEAGFDLAKKIADSFGVKYNEPSKAKTGYKMTLYTADLVDVPADAFEQKKRGRKPKTEN